VDADHDLTECMRRTGESPAACRRVLHELTTLAKAQELQYDPKWQSALSALDALVFALRATPRNQSRFAR
jgi:hypothetical protein